MAREGACSVRRLLVVLVASSLPMAVTSCVDDASTRGTVTVFAAASLTDAFTDVAVAFEDAHPDATVELNFAGSSTLREQILQGAPADVYAPADVSNMDRVVHAGLVAEPETFATNDLQIAVPPGNPAHVEGLEDFGEADLVLGLCAEEVPCGEFSRRVLEAAGVTPEPDTREPDVRALLTKVEAGELDAGIVYTTDVVSAANVEGIDIPQDRNVVATYPIGVVRDAEPVALVAAFVDFVLGADGQAILRSHGFGAP